jgi:mRNA interferase RelE/StbE
MTGKFRFRPGGGIGDAGTMKLEFESAALKSLMRMPKKDGAELLAKLKTFAENPYSPHPWAKTFGAKRGRVRHGDWRAIYEINDGKLVVLVLKVADRKEAYR